MGKDRKKSKTKEVVVFLGGLLVFRVSVILLRMFMDRLTGYLEGIMSALGKWLGAAEKKTDRSRLIKGWPKSFGSFLLLLAQKIGREHFLALASLLLLSCLSLLLVYVPRMWLVALLGTFVVFANIFLSKLLLLSGSVRVMTKKSLWLKPPPISEFLLAFPLDYFGIVLSFANFFLITATIWGEAFVGTRGLLVPPSFGDHLLYSLSCITTLDLSTIVAVTLWGKLLSFAELLLGIFFLIVFGSMIIGLFLTEKETAEQKDYAEEKKQVLDSVSAVFGPWVHKLPGLLKDVQLSPAESPSTSPKTKTARKLIVSITYPASSRFRSFQLSVPCCRLKDWADLLPAGAAERLSEAGLPLQKIMEKIEENASGAVSTMEWTDKEGSKMTIDIHVQEGQ